MKDYNIDSFLAFEVKKEIADRYFGFRKLIEDDIRDYDDQILASSLRLEQKIGYDLVRLYILLKDEKLIHQFFTLAGLDQIIFFDPYLTESPTIRKRVFVGQQSFGITKAGRFKNMIMVNYENLSNHINEYRDNLMKIAEDHENIVEEIRVFQKKHDLGSILDFFRSLDSYGGGSGGMEGGLMPRSEDSLRKKMQVHAPPPVEELLPVLPRLAPWDEIKKKLKPIIDRAFLLHGDLDWKEIVRP